MNTNTITKSAAAPWATPAGSYASTTAAHATTLAAVRKDADGRVPPRGRPV